MAIAFPDIDPYEVLELDKSATPIEIKKQYKKLCLKYHPDKLQQTSESNVDKDHFPKLQFAYSILSDPAKRNRYDTLGSLGYGDDVEDDEVFDWKEFFEGMNEKITIEMIEEDKLKYQNSTEEMNDILNNFVYYEGDFLKLFEVIPHLEFDELEENRVFKIIENAIDEDELEVENKNIIKSFEKYKRSRKTKVKQMLKKLAKEAKEAKELEKTIKDKSNRNLRNESDLKSLIQSRQNNRLNNLIDNLESKYLNKKGDKRSHRDVDDDEFERIQKNLMNKKSKNK
ncbi:DnaJ-domain-containing protein [Hyphopichia burtonii NRRL Y-1933]|uniref:DnaJ-domain-containing protein n=1 Tax=Hyphopichia burtonii NRRL Y-1933 TaxID=984485 RepID=A0A1E4RBX5_9ASCO|nr:DnaJ-domain-containing protein [Hyphopichia burtonii NRRL Y-1933]ODV64762.1 DnaJ-domain-containing protein [Hyphopichia burtonii NRRL Y-1933]